jgi:hypothetical protein
MPAQYQMNERPEIAFEILQYLVDNPKAQDTLEGIVTWWLLVRTIKQQRQSVKEALAILVEDGFVIAKKGSDTRTYYKINRRQHEKIISLLKQREHKK